MNVEEEGANENAQGVTKVEKRREDARALRKLSRKEKNLSLISHVGAFGVRCVLASLLGG